MLEKNLIKRFMTELKKLEPACWYFKVHGQPFQTRGIPDVLICFRGLFVGMEFKIIRDKKMNVTPYQEYTLEQIHKAGGFPLIVWYNNKQERYGIIKNSFVTVKEAAKYFHEESIKLKNSLGSL